MLLYVFLLICVLVSFYTRIKNNLEESLSKVNLFLGSISCVAVALVTKNIYGEPNVLYGLIVLVVVSIITYPLNIMLKKLLIK